MSKPIRGIDFGPVWGASGVQGFEGEGYWFHRIAGLIGNNLDGTVTFVAKTVTTGQRKGNMPLDERNRPREWLPRCIWVHPLRGIALNAVSLSNPGAEHFFQEGVWQFRQKPFMLSWMPVQETPDKRLIEAMRFARLFENAYKDFRVSIALQYNVSCPNTDHDQQNLLDEATQIIEILRGFEIPIVIKVCAAPSAEKLLPLCAMADGVTISNTVPFSDLTTVFPEIDWEQIFPGMVSPLRQKVGMDDGLSGAPLLRLTARWVRQIRELGYTGHVNAGGGILQPSDVDVLHAAGADSISLSSVMILRGWVPFLIPRIIRRAHKLFC